MVLIVNGLVVVVDVLLAAMVFFGLALATNRITENNLKRWKLFPFRFFFGWLCIRLLPKAASTNPLLRGIAANPRINRWELSRVTKLCRDNDTMILVLNNPKTSLRVLRGVGEDPRWSVVPEVREILLQKVGVPDEVKVMWGLRWVNL